MTFTTVTAPLTGPRNPHAQWLWLLASFALALALFGTGLIWNQTQGTGALTNGTHGSARLLTQAELIDDGSAGTAAPPPETVIGAPVSLPHQSRDAGGGETTYRLQVDSNAPAVDRPPMGMCVFRGSSGASVWLDGRLLTAAPPGAAGLRSARNPQFHSFPPDLPAGRHRLDIGIHMPPGLPAALSEILVGDGADVRRACNAIADSERARHSGSLALMALLGLIALGVGWVQRDRTSIWFALVSATWLSHHAFLYTDQAWIDEPLWVTLFFVTRPLAALPAAFFALGHANATSPRANWALLALFAIGYGTFFWLPRPAWPDWIVTFGVAILLALGWTLWRLVRVALHRPGISGLVLSTTLFFGIISNVADLGRWMGLLPFGPRLASSLVIPLISLSLGVLLIERLIQFLKEEARNGERMRKELDLQRAQIAEDYATMQEQRDRIAILEERKRIVRDMHDGLGTQLVSASALLNSSETSSGPMRDVIDRALQELRIVLDVLSSPMHSDEEDDLGTLPLLLGKLRHRMEPVLRARGITMRWDVDDLPADFLPRDQDKLQLLRLVQEAFANIIKHAGASEALFTAHSEADRIVIEVADNGRGIDPRVAAEGSETGHGILSMRARAEVLGGRLEIEANAPGTRVRVSFPRRPAANGPPRD